jgi:predicted NBD/HSP70 family sugar kinase
VIPEWVLLGCDKHSVLGIGGAGFGSFSGEEKILENVASFPELENFDINQFFKTRYSITPEIVDISISKVLYEIWLNNHGTNGNFLLVTAGSGIGCVTAIDGRIVFSKYSHAGEFGHSIYQMDGDACACGRKGCLETLCSINAIMKKIQGKLKNKDLKFQDAIRLYHEENQDVTEIVNRAGRWLGIAIANQVNSLALDEILIAGESLKLGDKFYDILDRTVREYAFPVFIKDLKIIKSTSGEESTSIGAASILIRKVFEDSEYLKSVIMPNCA